MLTESPKVRSEGDVRRRWFYDEFFDLVVWQSPEGKITGFDLCYDKTGEEKIFFWREGASPRHAAIDSGEDSPLTNRSPVAVADGALPRGLPGLFMNQRQGWRCKYAKLFLTCWQTPTL